MKTAKIVIGIISIVAFLIIIFQSCATGLLNVIESNTEDQSGAGGALLGFFMLIAGIIGIATTKSKGGGITASIFFLFGSLVGFANIGTYTDLIIWSVVSLAFGLVFLIGSLCMKKLIQQPLIQNQTYQPYNQPYNQTYNQPYPPNSNQPNGQGYFDQNPYNNQQPYNQGYNDQYPYNQPRQ